MTNYYTTIFIITLFALFVLSILVSENNRLPRAKKKIFIATSILIASAAIAEYIGIWVGGKEIFVAFLIDINGLKVVNDSIGHEAGDELICGAAECITATIGKRGQTFRIGGDEFVVFATMKQERIQEKLLELTHETEKWSGKKVGKMSVSVGYAIAEESKDLSIEELVKVADKRMYEQKADYYRKSGCERRKI